MPNVHRDIVLIRGIRRGDLYRRKDNHGVFHYLRWGDDRYALCDDGYSPLAFKFVYDEDNTVAEHTTCLGCACRA